jgi:hypothetical protein
MRLRSALLFVAAALLSLHCSSAEAVEPDADASEDAITSSATPPRRETRFASGDVDLTTYTSAGKAEWASFEAFYKARHTKPKERDTWDELVKRAKEKLPGGEEARITSYLALRGYTAQTGWFFSALPQIDQDYKVINTLMRAVDDRPDSSEAKKALASVEGYVKSAASAVNSFPPVKGIVHRRVYRSNCDATCIAGWLAPYEVGKFVREPSFVSTSQNEEVTCFFRGQAHFVIEAEGAAHSVMSFSEMPFEEEAIFAPGAVFKVEKVERDQQIVCKMEDGWSPQLGVAAKLTMPPTETIIRLRAVK